MPDRALNAAIATNIGAATVNVVLASYEGDNASFARLGLSNAVVERFKEVVENTLNRLTGLQTADDLELIAYDAGHKPDSHQLAWVEGEQVKALADHVRMVARASSAEEFRQDDAFMDGLHHYIIMVEQRGQAPLRFFRKCSARIQLKNSNTFAAVFARGTFNMADEHTLLFDDKVDCFVAGGKVFILNAHNFQTIFRYHEDLQRVATDSLATIKACVPIHGFNAFADSCMTHVNKLAKLRNIAAKPYLQHLTMADIKKTIKRFNLTGVRVETKNGAEVLVYDEADRWVVLKLLDDDYLGSVMTDQNYEVNSKRPMN